MIGRLVSTDTAGSHYYHLYMHVGADPHAVDLMPGATSGALYAGMDSAGSMVYYTTKDALATAADQDTDTSADLYRADVNASTLSAALTRVSVRPGAGAGGVGDTDACSPRANSAHVHWNSLAATGNCDVLAIGGAGGVASSSGAVYFTSPEQLDGSKGVVGEPNLYRAEPGQPAQFVARLESETNGPQPPIKTYRPATATFPVFAKATALAVDHATGNVYVLDAQVGQLKKYSSSGAQVKFTAGGGSGTNHLNGSDAPTGFFSEESAGGLPSQIAVDPSGKVYVPDYNHNVVNVFASTGAYLSQIAVTSPAAVAINPSSQNVYVLSNTSGGIIKIFTPAGAPVSSFPVFFSPKIFAVKANGKVLVATASFFIRFGAAGGIEEVIKNYPPPLGMAVDPVTDDLFLNQGNRYIQLDSEGNPKAVSAYGDGEPVGEGILSGSTAIAMDSGQLYVINNGGVAVAKFALALRASPYIDSQLLLDSLGAADTRHPEDFQTNPSGEQAVFASTAPVTGFESAGHAEVFRSEAGTGIDCVSCSPTGATPLADSDITGYGSSLTDDGRVFFTSAEPLVLRDSNEKRDAYEWEDGTQQLISPGTSPNDSSLLSVSADGTDALFFTRDKLVDGDGNGANVRLYDAREGGGFTHGPPAFQCAASDECHGAGSQPPNPASIPTATSTPGQYPPRHCRRGAVLRKGHCVRRPHHKRHGHRAGSGRGGAR